MLYVPTFSRRLRCFGVFQVSIEGIRYGILNACAVTLVIQFVIYNSHLLNNTEVNANILLG